MLSVKRGLNLKCGMALILAALLMVTNGQTLAEDVVSSAAAEVKEAKADVEPVWIDVRTLLEHKVDNIPGDPRISYVDIVKEIPGLGLAKDTPIRLYCRSGGRAGKAETDLKRLGFTDVKNVGGIDDARKLRGMNQ